MEFPGERERVHPLRGWEGLNEAGFQLSLGSLPGVIPLELSQGPQMERRKPGLRCFENKSPGEKIVHRTDFQRFRVPSASIH